MLDSHGYQELDKRCILPAARRLDWQVVSSGWRYPVYDIFAVPPYNKSQILGYRFKRAKSAMHTKFKYLWLGGKPESERAEWYGLRNFLATFNYDTYTELFIVNGEPALLAMLTAGVNNVLTTTLSEVAVPKSLPELLEQTPLLEKIYFICDNDAAGRRAATNWRDALIDTGVEFYPRQLTPDCFTGQPVPAGADVNDLWMHHAFDREAFKHQLNHNLQHVLLPEPAPEPPESTFVKFQNYRDSENAREAVIQHFDLTHTAQASSGFYKKMVHCPFHDDKNPSAGISESGVLNCFRCGAYSPQEVADALNLSWRDNAPDTPRPSNPRRPLTASERAALKDEIDGVIKSLLELTSAVATYDIMNVDRGRLATVTANVMALHRRLRDGDRVTVADNGIIGAAVRLVATLDKLS